MSSRIDAADVLELSRMSLDVRIRSAGCQSCVRGFGKVSPESTCETESTKKWSERLKTKTFRVPNVHAVLNPLKFQ